MTPRERALAYLDKANGLCDEIEQDRATRDPDAPDALAAWQAAMPIEPEQLAPQPRPEPKRKAMAMSSEQQREWDDWFDRRASVREKALLEGVGKALSQLMRDATEAHVKLMRQSAETFTTAIGKLEERIQELEAQATERDSHADLARALPTAKRLTN